ncbi:non-ribosomal peptide synthetase, partial [Arenimonas aestuarii]
MMPNDVPTALVHSPQDTKKSNSFMNSSIYTPGNSGRIVPLTPDQQGLWFECKASEDVNASYNLSMGLTLTGRVDLPALKRAFQQLASNNESLRCSFPDVDGEALCRVANVEDFTLPVVELTLPDSAPSDTYIERIAGDELRTPFNVSDGPLARVVLIRESDSRVTFLFTVHHLISDGRSMALIGNELASLYTSASQGSALPSPKPHGVAGPISSQLSPELQAKRMEDARYWQEELRGAPPFTDLPWDHANPTAPRHIGDQVGFHFDEEDTRALGSLARKHDVSTFTAMFAIWSVLISKLANQNEVVVGVAVNKIGAQVDKDFIGFQVGMLPIRIAMRDESFSTLLTQVKRKVSLAKEHQSLSFGELVKLTRGPRDPKIHPVFQTSFTWPHPPEKAPEFSGLDVEVLACSSEKFGFGKPEPFRKNDAGAYSLTAFGGTSTSAYAKHSLAVSAWKVDGRIACGIEFSTSFLERDTVLRWISHWKNLLRSVASDPDGKISSHGLMSAEEEAAHVSLTNSSNEGFLEDGKPLFRLVQEWARIAPNRLAIDCTDGHVSFCQLEERSNRVASRLYVSGIRDGQRVAVCMRRGAGMIVSLLALQKVGATFVPIDPDHPTSRLRRVIDDCTPAAVIGDSTTVSAINLLGLDAVLDLAHLESGAVDEDVSYPEPTSRPDDISYIIYTSGTTGNPKGVCTTNAAYEAFLSIASEFCEPTLGSRILQFSSFTFDAFVMELAMSLARGATLCIPAPGITLAGDDLAEQVNRLRPSHAFIPPSVLATLDHLSDLKSVICLLSGAEPVSKDLVNKWRTNRIFSNVYGPTETTVICTAYRVSENLENHPPIGRPFSNSRVYVLDSAGKPQPTGVRGELYVGGSSVASHYFNSPELTEERFLPDPFSRRPGSRMYRTGDFGCWKSDGQLQFLGRSDTQIKIRGFRVEIGEVEHHLKAISGVVAAAVVVETGSDYGNRLIAYFEASIELNSKHMRDKLRACIPAHMVPAVFVRVGRLPLNRNGKVDRRALEAAPLSEAPDGSCDEPLGDCERLVADLWSQLLRLPRIGRDDHFFDLGGHSLLAVQVISRVRQSLGVDVVLADLFA